MPTSPLTPDLPIALFMQGALGQPDGKMGYGLLRYGPNPIVAIVDKLHAGQLLPQAFPSLQPTFRPPIPIVGHVEEALNLGAEVLVLGIAPGGGQIPEDWYPDLDSAVSRGMSLVNGLHQHLKPRYPRASGFIWDIRVEPEGLVPGSGKAAALRNRRILMVGTDMAVGKMTAGLELWKAACGRGISAGFVATGQIGITITGGGVPLDAIRVDYAAGAIEREVLAQQHQEWVIIEGQGALNHPASTSPLPLLRGSCPTDLVLCCRANQETLLRFHGYPIPDLNCLMRLYEDVGEACGVLARPIVRCVAVNTAHLPEAEARDAIDRISQKTGLPARDPVRDGASILVDAIASAV